MDVLQQGAEARLYLGTFKDKPCLIKERFAKRYRHADLDEQICKQRMKAECKGITRCSEIDIVVPKVYHMDLQGRKIYMEYFPNAITAKEYIGRVVAVEEPPQTEQVLKVLCKQLGCIISHMHMNNIIHGDLTTSNILIDSNSEKDGGYMKRYTVILIDFGLSQYSNAAEDKAVDLYVLERALLSTHNDHPYLFAHILSAYEEQCVKDKSVLVKLEEVRARGRKKNMVG